MEEENNNPFIFNPNNLDPNRPFNPYSLVMFFAVVIAFFVFGEKVGSRVFGVICMIEGVRTLVSGSVSVGWRGQKPSFVFKGAYVVFYFIFLFGFGLFMIFR